MAEFLFEKGMSIPRILHTGVFGSHKLTNLNHRCLTSWGRVLPDFEIRQWCDNGVPAINHRFMTEALAKCPGNCPNFLRYYALYKFGGIYLDNDVELLKPFDLEHRCFLAFQRDDTVQDCINTAVLGAEKGNLFIKRCLDEFDGWPGDIFPVIPGCTMPTDLLRNATMQLSGCFALNQAQAINGVTVYDKSAFYPWRWDEQPDLSRITKDTVAVHHWEGSWK